MYLSSRLSKPDLNLALYENEIVFLIISKLFLYNVVLLVLADSINRGVH